MDETEQRYNATLWAVGSPWEITCFRVRVDREGHVVATSVADFNRVVAEPSFEEAVRAKLRERYGEQLRITVVADGGAGFDYFRREVGAGRYPTPPGTLAPSEPPQQRQRGLWDERPG